MTDAEFNRRRQQLEVWGYHTVEHALPSSTANGGSFYFETSSLYYEIVLAGLYLLIIRTYVKFKKMFTNLRKKQYSVIAIKNFEMRSLFDSDSEEDQSKEEATKRPKSTVGTGQARRGRKATEDGADED